MNRKQKLVLTGFLGFTFLFGCSQVDDGEVKAELPEGFEEISETFIDGYGFYEVKNIKTDCYYIFSSKGIEQMFIEKDGVSVPYCN